MWDTAQTASSTGPKNSRMMHLQDPTHTPLNAPVGHRLAFPPTLPGLPRQEAEVAPTQRWREALTLIDRHLSYTRRQLHAGDSIQSAGADFNCLHLVHFGAIKSVVVAANGSHQLAGLHLKGDWIGFDGIASGQCACDAYAMDTSEIWSLRYVVLLKTAERVPEIAHALYAAMSGQLAYDRAWRFALATMPADARLADFLRSWARSLALRELRTDHITLRLTRAEIGNYLGMTLETVSRSFTRLAELELIAFEGKGRRHFTIRDVAALEAFVDGKTTPCPTAALPLQ